MSLSPGEGIFLGAAGAVAGAGLFFSAFGRLRLWRTMANTPTSKVRSVAMGEAELSGLAQPEPGTELLIAPLSSVHCVWWRFSIEEERTRYDSKGRREDYWVTLVEQRFDNPFRLADGTGDLRVIPLGAEVDTPPRLNLTTGGLFGAARPGGPMVERYPGGLGRRKRYKEWRIEPQRPLYALGNLKPTDGGPVMVESSEQIYFIATMSEAEASRDVFVGLTGRLIGGLALFAGGLSLVLFYTGNL